MSQQIALDMLWNEFTDLDGQFIEETTSKLDDVQYSTELPTTLAFQQEDFDWEDIKLEDTESLLHLSGCMELPATAASTDTLAELADSMPSPSSSTDSCDDTEAPAGRKVDGLLNLYGLDDEQLGDITLKKLKSMCHSTSDFSLLKTHRRTCLNRHYARSSRTKQQNKTSSLATKLKETQQEVIRLQQDNEMKDATIRCLQLELEIMRSLNK